MAEQKIHKSCWHEDRAEAILRAVALANKEPEFLAVHQPIRDFQITSTIGRAIPARDDALLADLSAPSTHHAFCVVEGEPGAGKSHLIRWLHVKWPKSDHVLLIERADGSLTGTLRQLRDQLGEKYAHLFKNLSQSVETTFDGRVRMFQNNLSASLAPNFFAKKLGDEDWCGTWQLERLIGNPSVQDNWTGPQRILRIISGDGGKRNSASASFDFDDIVSLAQVQSAAEGLPPKAMMLLRTLKNEADLIAQARQAHSLEDLLLDESFAVPQSRQLLRALNDRRNFAVQPILGISIDGLKDMFLNLRSELLAEHKRLVLLLEDVTSWQGIDGQLIDALAVDSNARSDVSDMVAVVGMTPTYFKEIQGNYGGRVTHVVRLGRERSGGGFQETIQLASPEAQAEFAARYLRAVRIDKPQLDVWFENGADPEAVPNKCLSCGEREACFAAFGDEGGIGLYPYNRNALTHLFGALEDPKASQNLQTPRGMIQGVLAPILNNPQRIDDGQFPPVEIETSEWMPERRLQPTGFVQQIIDAATSDAGQRDQLRRLVMMWGNAGQDLNVESRDGARLVSGIAEGIFEAFNLPWIGEGLEEQRAEPASGTGPSPSEPSQTYGPFGDGQPTDDQATRPDPNLRGGGADTGNAAGAGRTGGEATAGGAKGGGATGGTTTGGARPPSASGLTPTKLKTLAEQLQSWKGGKAPRDETLWEALLGEIMTDVRDIVRDPMPGLWESVFNRGNVKLEGAGRTDQRHFVIPRADWAMRGIEAYLNQRIGGARPVAQRESDSRAIARMLRRLAERAEQQLARRLALTPDPWHIAGALAQMLLARAWLRGTIAPTAPMASQFAELLSSEIEPRSLPTERVESWSDLTKATDHYNIRFRAMLRRLLELPLGDGAALLNAGAVAGAMESLAKTLRTVDLPADAEFTRGLEDLAKLVDLARQTDQKLRQIPARESRSLAERRERMRVLLRSTTLSHHITKIGDALEHTTSALAQAAAVEKQEFGLARDKLKQENLLDEASEAWIGLRRFLLKAEPEFEDEAKRFEYVLAAPIASIRPTVDALEKGEVAIRAAYKTAYQFVHAQQADGDLTVVNGFGERLHSAIERINLGLRGGT